MFRRWFECHSPGVPHSNRILSLSVFASLCPGMKLNSTVHKFIRNKIVLNPPGIQKRKTEKKNVNRTEANRICMHHTETYDFNSLQLFAQRKRRRRGRKTTMFESKFTSLQKPLVGFVYCHTQSHRLFIRDRAPRNVIFFSLHSARSPSLSHAPLLVSFPRKRNSIAISCKYSRTTLKFNLGLGFLFLLCFLPATTATAPAAAIAILKLECV